MLQQLLTLFPQAPALLAALVGGVAASSSSSSLGAAAVVASVSAAQLVMLAQLVQRLLPFAHPVAPPRASLTFESREHFVGRIDPAARHGDTRSTVECLVFRAAANRPNAGTLWCGMGDGSLVVCYKNSGFCVRRKVA